MSAMVENINYGKIDNKTTYKRIQTNNRIN